MSNFKKKQLHYLGHKISAEGLEPLPEKLEALCRFLILLYLIDNLFLFDRK